MNEIYADATIAINRHDWQELCRILELQLPGYEVWAFGSRVTGSAKPFSDLDLVIRTEQPLTFEQMATLKEAFDDSDLTIRVDLVDWAATGAAFREIIQQGYVVIKEARLQEVLYESEQ